MISQKTGTRATVLISVHATFVLFVALVVGACVAAIDSPSAEGEPKRDQTTHRADAPSATTNAHTRTSNQSELEFPSAHVAVADISESRRGSSKGTVAGMIQPVVGRGQELYTKYCALCHGDTGDGGGKFAYLMNPRPRNFQDGNFKLSTTQNQIPTDEDLFRTISNGMPGSAMPPWGHLPNSDIDALVTYVRQIHVEATREMLTDWIREGMIEDSELGQQALTVGDDLYWYVDPSTWATAVLIR